MSGSFNIYEKLIMNKLWALVHDVSIKMWNISRHEHETDRIIMNLDLPSEIRTETKRMLDALASMIDRQLLHPLYMYEIGKTVESPDHKVFVNLFDPSYRVDIRDDVDVGDIFKKVIKDLRKIRDEIRNTLDKRMGRDDDLRKILENLLILHTLSYLNEILWVKHGGPQTVADTRVPTHPIFSHNSAVSSMANWYVENRFKGYYVRIDLGGIHRFIANSRKLRDLWASSYLASGIVWMAISPLVFLLGPDIVLTPSLNLNPVYGYTLMTWFKEIDQSLYDSTSEVLKREGGSEGEDSFEMLMDMILSENPPSHSIQPGIFTLILPGREVIREAHNLLKRLDKAGVIPSLAEKSPFKLLLDEDIDRHIHSGDGDDREWVRGLIQLLIRKAWGEVYRTYMLEKPIDKVISSVLSTDEELETKMDGSSDDVVKSYIEFFVNTPPFIQRVYVAKVEDAWKRIREFEVAIKEKLDKGSRINIKDGFLEPLLIEFVNDEVERDKYLNFPLRYTPYYVDGVDREDPGEGVTYYTEEVFRYVSGQGSGRTMTIYYVLGKNKDGRYVLKPSNGKKAPGYRYCTSCGELPAILHVEVEDVFFKDKEKLCPICLCKRAIGSNPTELARLIFGVESSQGFTPEIFASTSALANKDYLDFLTHIQKEFKSDVVKKHKLKGVIDVLERVSDDKGKDKEVYLINPEAEGLFLSGERYKSLWMEFTRKLYENLKANRVKISGGSVSKPSVRIYYGIYITDGDNMGKLISGDLYRAKTIPRLRKDNGETRGKDAYMKTDDCVEEIEFYINYIHSLLYLEREDIRDLYKEVLSRWGCKLVEKYLHAEANSCRNVTLSIEEYVELANEVYKEVKESVNPWQNDDLLMTLVTFLGTYLLKPIPEDGKVFRIKPRNIVSMAYLTTISRSLVISILNDIYTVSKMDGVVVYAGGDDLMAVLPIVRFEFSNGEILFRENVLEGLSRIRGYYSLGDYDEPGFAKLGDNYVMPMFIGHGRSASLMITHYRTPLKMAIEYCEDILNDVAKDESIWLYKSFGDDDNMKNDYIQYRDGLVFGVIHSGNPRYVKLPNFVYYFDVEEGGKVLKTLDTMKTLLEYIRWLDDVDNSGCRLSKSILKDVDRDIILESIEGKGANYIGDMLAYIMNLFEKVYLGRNLTGEGCRDKKDNLVSSILHDLKPYFRVIDISQDGGEPILKTLLPVRIWKALDILRVGWRE